MNKAEQVICAMQYLYPASLFSRERCLSTIFDSSNFCWEKGCLIPVYEMKGYEKILKQVKKGSLPTLEEALMKHHLDLHAEDKRQCITGKTVEESAQVFYDMSIESANHPCIYSLYEKPSYRGLPYQTIPKDIQPEWREVALEYFRNVARSKIDFDEVNILVPSERKIHSTVRTDSHSEIEKDLIKKIMGEDYKEPTQAQKEKTKLEWDTYYSPAARARRANDENKNARKVIAIMAEKFFPGEKI